jgi:hypothetical protein
VYNKTILNGGNKMSKPIAGYPKWEQREVVLRRIKNNGGGLGTLSALRAAEIMAGRYIKKNKLTFEHNKQGVSVGGVQYQSVVSYFEQNNIVSE